MIRSLSPLQPLQTSGWIMRCDGLYQLCQEMSLGLDISVYFLVIHKGGSVSKASRENDLFSLCKAQSPLPKHVVIPVDNMRTDGGSKPATPGQTRAQAGILTN